MTDGLLQRLHARRSSPELFVNHYGSSEIYTFTIDQDAPREARIGRTRRHQPDDPRRPARRKRRRRSRRAGRGRRDHRASPAGDEAFEGYWRRPDADARALRDGWYFTGDTGYLDADGDLYVTGRVDDMIITGGENVSPVEIESCLSLHPAVVRGGRGRPARRALGQDRDRLRQAPARRSTPQELDAPLPRLGPRRISSARAATCSSTSIPKSPVGKLLRRKLVEGEYDAERRRLRPSERPNMTA